MRLGKKTGGCTISHGGKSYTWKNDGAVIQVPRELADDLLSIRGADYFEPQEDAEVTEPAPDSEKAVTEPAPADKAAVTEGPPRGGTKA
jgi:hypothetical protein